MATHSSPDQLPFSADFPAAPTSSLARCRFVQQAVPGAALLVLASSIAAGSPTVPPPATRLSGGPAPRSFKIDVAQGVRHGLQARLAPTDALGPVWSPRPGFRQFLSWLVIISLHSLGALGLVATSTQVALAQSGPGPKMIYPPSGVSIDDAAFDRLFTHYTADVNGTRIHYVTGGRGFPVVLLHGNLRTWRVWRRVMLTLAEKYTVIVPDLRGLGDSGRPRPADGYDKKTVAEDIYQLVRSLGYERINLVGHDVGGWVAYAYAANHRAAVNRLAIVDVALPGIGLEKTMNPATGGSFHFGFAMTADLSEALVAGREAEFIHWFARRNSVVPHSVSEADLTAYIRAYSELGAMRAQFSYYRTLLETDAPQNRESAKQKLQMPTCAIGADRGAADATLNDLRVVAETVRSVEIKNCGHSVPEDRPAELARELLLFFADDKPERK